MSGDRKTENLLVGVMAMIAVSGYQLQLEGFYKLFILGLLNFFPYLSCGYGHINVCEVLSEN